MFAATSSGTLAGVEGRPVSVEVQVADGLPSFSIVALPDASCPEARERVGAVIIASHRTWLL
ncbi:MAG: magnesium chelatase domain-containing protein [Acidimicrobiales bacterium]|nr:magnesium chelatase domain-containing protein [Acidimicrobiales bacterium]MDG1877533.1 magnesium chelatase domain-containing protein [Acidimicrobiales bacterium]